VYIFHLSDHFPASWSRHVTLSPIVHSGSLLTSSWFLLSFHYGLKILSFPPLHLSKYSTSVLLIEPGLFFKNGIVMHPCLPVFTLCACK